MPVIKKPQSLKHKLATEAINAAEAKEQLKYRLPDFNLQALLEHIQNCVDKAPYGIVQLFIDLFCGAGGTSEGIEQALAENGEKCSVIIAGINHDIKAIYSQAKNHPLAYYSTEDIRIAKLQYIKTVVDICRKRWPQCPIIVWASLECTNHSNAKGGMSRDADSRTLAWHLFRYIKGLKPDGIWIENVKEFSEWGPLMIKTVMHKKGKKITLPEPIENKEEEVEFCRKKIAEGWTMVCPLEKQKKPKKKDDVLQAATPWWIPIKKLKGTYYKPWKEKVKRHGYDLQEWFLNAADYGVPQNRHRFFPIFMRKGWAIEKPEPTHGKIATNKPLPNGLKPHIPIKECLDFTIDGESIFTPGKITSDKSFERYYNGLIKFVAGGKENFMAQRNGGDPLSKIYPTSNPARTVTKTGGNQELIEADYFIANNYSSHNNTKPNPGSSINEPSRTVTTWGAGTLAHCQFFITKYGSDDINKANPGHSISEPCRTLTTMNHFFLTKAESFIDVIYGNGTPRSINNTAATLRLRDGQSLIKAKFIVNYQGQSKSNSIDEKSPTLMVKDKLALAQVNYFIINNYTSGGQHNSIDDKSPAIPTNPKTGLVKIEPFISSSNFDNVGSSINKPAPPLLASRHHHYILNPSYYGHATSIDEPSVVIVARQDKAPLYLVSVEHGLFGIPVFKTDTPIMIKIKEFMALYLIKEITMRMLVVPELLKIQSFPANYYLAGGSTAKKKFIGNAVPPLMARRIAESMHRGLVRFIVKKFKLAA